MQASYGLQNIEIASYSGLEANNMEHNTQILLAKHITIQRAFIQSIDGHLSVPGLFPWFQSHDHGTAW